MKKYLKIGVLVDQLLAGGVQITAIEQVKHLNKSGFKAKLLILMRKKYSRDFSYLLKGIPHEYLSDSYPKFFRKTYKFPIFNFLSSLHLLSPFLAPKLFSKKDFDLIISHGTTTSFTASAIYKKTKIPYIAFPHDPISYILDHNYSKTILGPFLPFLKSLAEYFERGFVKNASEVITLSSFHNSYLRKTYNVDPKVLALGINIPKKIPSKRGEYILSTGRWEEGKNPGFFIELMKNLPKAKLIIAGSWRDKKEYLRFREKIKKEKLTKQIELVPFYTREGLKKLFAKARVWILPNFEAFGLSALEAAAAGVPIIIPYKSGITEKFTHGVHGFFPERIDFKEYKRYITKLLKNERLSFSMGKSAYEKVKKEYSWEKHAEKLIRIVNPFISFDSEHSILILEAAHTSKTFLAGGDRVLEKIAYFFPSKYKLQIVTTNYGIKHWRSSNLKFREVLIPQNRLDNSENPIFVFILYLVRIWQSYLLIKGQKIDLIISSTNIFPDVIPPFLIKLRKPKVPWLIRFHHLIPPPYKRPGNFLVNLASYGIQFISLICLRINANTIICINQNTGNSLKKLFFSGQSLKIVPNGIDFIRFNRARIAEIRSYDAIFLGRIHPSKGIFDLPYIWQQVNMILPYAKLAVVGGGTDSNISRFKELITIKKVKKSVQVLGALTDNQVLKTLKKSKLFIFTDYEGGFSLAVAEAMASGLPVVGYNLPIFGDVYKKGYITVPLGDKNAMAKAIVNLLQNPRKMKQLSTQAVSQAKKLDWSISAKQFIKIINASLKIT